MSAMIWIQPESSDLSKLYWSEISGDATYSGLASGAAATFGTKLTKQEIINGLAITEQFDKFFTNQALTQADYLANIDGIIYGNDEYTSPGISVAIEQFGIRLVALSEASLVLFKSAKDILDIYFDTEISGAIGGVSGGLLPWTAISKSDISASVSLIEAFKKVINNEVAAQADYGSTVAAWRKNL